MKSTAAANRYAKALFLLAVEEQCTGRIREELEMLNGLFEESDELRRTVLTPLYPARQRQGVLGVVADRSGLSPLLRNFVFYLIDQRRLLDIQSITAELVRLVEDSEGRTTAQVISASPLDEARQERLRRALSERTGRDVQLECDLDPALIGGAIAKVGDLVFDGSLRTQLDTLRTHLMKGP
ncbi:MAG: ATP synthase F1 subunit delta [Myxococcota bacterium]